MPQTIELDCPPGHPRPGDLIEGVIEGTGLTLDDLETSNPFFGHQTWVVKPDAEAKYMEHKEKTIKPRVIELYNSGVIRYGSW